MKCAPTHDSAKARLARLMSPGFSYCLRCGMPWSRVRAHITRFDANRGCFPLCESCWAVLGSPEARIEYYAALIDLWASDLPVDETTMQAIKRAVANEPAGPTQ